MRIIAGKLRGATLAPIKGTDIRPTLDRVRESVFNILTPYLDEESVFLDLFSGTGVNGFEALSRGVKKSIFVDASPQSLKIVRQNAEKLRVLDDCVLIRGSIPEKLVSIGRQFEPVGIVYADPPFNYPDYHGLLCGIDLSGVVEPDGLVLVEHDAKRSTLPEDAGNLHRYREETYGHTQLSFYRNESSKS